MTGLVPHTPPLFQELADAEDVHEAAKASRDPNLARFMKRTCVVGAEDAIERHSERVQEDGQGWNWHAMGRSSTGAPLTCRQEMKKKYYALRTSQKDKAQDLMQEAQKEAHYVPWLNGRCHRDFFAARSILSTLFLGQGHEDGQEGGTLWPQGPGWLEGNPVPVLLSTHHQAGQKEAEYEGNIGKAEKNTEHLSGVAEKLRAQ